MTKSQGSPVTTITLSDDSQTVVFITNDKMFCEFIEKRLPTCLDETKHLGSLGDFSLYALPLSGSDFPLLIHTTQGF